MDVVDEDYICFMCGREYDENKLLKLNIKRLPTSFPRRGPREPFAYRHPHALR